MLYNRKITAQENYGEHSYRDKYFGKKSSTVKISTGANTFFLIEFMKTIRVHVKFFVLKMKTEKNSFGYFSGKC